MANFTDPIKAGFGRLLERFHAQIVGDTPALREFRSRAFAKAAVWAPGRMVDQVEDMLAAWRKNDTSQAAQPTPFLPIMIAAMTKDFMPAAPDFTRNNGDYIDVMIPSDPKQRMFRMRSVTAEIRTQVVIAAADDPTARSIAMQLHAFCAELANRRFAATYKLAGLDERWPVVFEVPDIMSPAVPTEQKNLTLMAADLSLRATVPMLMAPSSSDPNDGQGGANADDAWADDYDPNGYLVVIEAQGKAYPPLVPSPPIAEWTVSTEEGP